MKRFLSIFTILTLICFNIYAARDIELIAKIAPKNDGFVGLVDADQVIGGLEGGTLNDDTIDATITRDTEWNTITKIETAISEDILVDTDINTQEKFEAKLFAFPVGSVSDWGDIEGTLSNQIDLQSALDAKLDENVAITGATKTKITYDSNGLVTSGTDATTADITDSTDKRYITDAALVILGNTSGENTGDQDLSTYALKSNVLELDNEASFTPDADYEPATKKYVDDSTATITDNLIQDTAWDVLDLAPFSHLGVTYDTGTNLVTFTVDEAINNYDWSAVTDIHIPNTLTIGADSTIHEDALPTNVVFTGDIDTKAKIDTIISEVLLSENTTFSGDVSGTYNATSVDAIIGRTVDDTDLANGNVMVFNSATGNFEFTDLDDFQLGLYSGTFTDAQLTAGVLTISHAFNLDADYKITCTVYDNNKNEVLTDETTYIDQDSIEIDLSSYGTITGTWSFVVIGDGATAVPRSIIVQESDGSPSASNVTTLYFDQDTGLHVTDLGGGIAEISIGSHWYNLQIDGQDTLTPTGEEALEFIAGDNVTLTTDDSSTPKSITISSLGAEGGSADRIYEGDSEVEVIDTSDGRVEITEDTYLVAKVDNRAFTVIDDDYAKLHLEESTTNYKTTLTKYAVNHKFLLATDLYNSTTIDDYAMDYEAEAATFFGNLIDANIAFPFSIACTMKANNTHTDRSPTVIVTTDRCANNVGDNNSWGFRVGYGAANSICTQSSDGTAGTYKRLCTEYGVVGTSNEHQLLAVWRGATDVDLFIDGVEVALDTAPFYGGSGTTVAPNTSYGPAIGASHYYTDSMKLAFDGAVDEVGFFNADKAADIENFYADGAAQRISEGEGNLIFLAHLDEGTGVSTRDEISATNGTHYKYIVGAPYVTSTGDYWIDGLTISPTSTTLEILETEDKEGDTGTVTLKAYDSNYTTYGDVELIGSEIYFKIDDTSQMYISSDGGVYAISLATGTTQVNASADTNEIWVDTDDGYTLKLGQ